MDDARWNELLEEETARCDDADARIKSAKERADGWFARLEVEEAEAGRGLMSYPKTKEQWWEMLNAKWDELFSIMNRYLPLNGMVGVDGEILTVPLFDHILHLKRERNPHLYSYLSAAYHTAPDSPTIHFIPSWELLCDLCSESYLLEDE